MAKVLKSPTSCFTRREFLGTAAIAYTALGTSSALTWFAESADSPSGSPGAFDLAETTIADLQAAMKSGKLTARGIAEKYLARIDKIDKHGPAVNAVIEINPDALAIADAMDKERKENKVRGPMHGVPVLI